MAASLAIAAFAASGTAAAFPTYSIVSPGCHESITMQALRAVRAHRPAARPLPALTRDERALIDDLPFETDPDMNDVGAVALLNGVRFNDLRGRAPNEVDELATIHGDPERQREHCLRSDRDDEPTGSESALRECRAFIRETIRDALDGLDPAGAPDPANRVPLAIDLSLRGSVDAPLPRFYVRMGQALHAVQDGFTHTYRAGDRTQVIVVLNYIELVEHDLRVERDGPPHSMELDRCDVHDDLHVRNVQLATQASFDLLAVALEDGKTIDEKMAGVDVVLDRYFTYRPGCSAANGWCDAPEQRLDEGGACGCAMPGSAGGGWLCGIFGVGSAIVLARRRRRRLVASALVVVSALDANAAHADVAPKTEPPPIAAEAQEDSRVALFGAGAVSVSNPAGAAMGGVRLRLGESWMVGVDGEWNGWYGVHSGRLRTGALSFYGTVIARFPLRFEPMSLRSAAHVGTAIQMVDLFGVPSGSTGLFLGFDPLGVAWRLNRSLSAVLYPLGIALPITQLTGAPYAYPQYRATLGLELSL